MPKTQTTKAHEFLLEASKSKRPEVHDLILSNGKVKLVTNPELDLFKFLARTIVGQQLSTKAARSIWTKIEDRARQKRCKSLESFFKPKFESDIRECGISKNKIRALSELNAAFTANELSAEILKESNYPELVDRITAIWGLGVWSADMCAMFYCQMPDVFPIGDLAIQQGIQKLCGGRTKPENIAKHFTPYRSYFARHIWTGIDTGYIK